MPLLLVFNYPGHHKLRHAIQFYLDGMPTLPSSSTTASFFLPGLVHQFGNMLLAVQGHVLHVEEGGIKSMQGLVLDVVQRGSQNLQVVRAILGEQTGAAGSASDLFVQIVELGRVPARECGITLQLSEPQKADVIWVDAEPFVFLCADTLRRWIQGVPSGVSGSAHLSLTSDGKGGARVRFGFVACAGSLPFPLPTPEVAHAIESSLLAANATAHVLSAAESCSESLEIRVPARLNAVT